MENKKVEVIVNEHIALDYTDFQKLFKDAFGSENVEKLTFINKDKENIIHNKNYEDYINSTNEFNQTQKLLNIEDINKSSIKKFEDNKDLIRKNNKSKNEIEKINQAISKKIEELKVNNSEDKEIIFEELKKNNDLIDQKCKIIDNFKLFEAFMAEGERFKKEIEEKNNDYANNFIPEVKESLNKEKETIKKEALDFCKQLIDLQLEEINKIEEERKKEFEKKIEEINYKKYMDSNDVIHNVKCKRCNNKPIYGVLYQCQRCREPYYLCEECEFKNYYDKNNKHDHNFIKIRKIKINKDDENNHNNNYSQQNEQIGSQKQYNVQKEIKPVFPQNNIYKYKDDEDKIEKGNYDRNDYSYSYKGKNIFEFDMSKKNIKYEIDFIILNNNKKDWKENETYLKSNVDSQIKIEDFKLNPLSQDIYQKVILSLPELNEFDEGDVDLILDFCVSNKIYGSPIKIVLRIIPDPKNQIIINFRKEFKLSKKDYPDDVILKTLRTCKYDFNKTFEYLISENLS